MIGMVALHGETILRIASLLCTPKNSCTRPAPSAPSSGGDNWRVDAKVGGGGLFLDLGSHMLDLVDWLLGPLQGVKGLAARLQPQGREEAGAGVVPSSAEVEDNVRIVFATPGTRVTCCVFLKPPNLALN